MEINEAQYETLQTLFPDCAVDVFSNHRGMTIVISYVDDENVYDLESVREVRFTDE